MPRGDGRGETGGREAREEAKEAEADSIRMWPGTRRKAGDLTATSKVKQKLEVGPVDGRVIPQGDLQRLRLVGDGQV